jgi:hypothetical protein
MPLAGCAAMDRFDHMSAVTALAHRQIVCIDRVEYIAMEVSDRWTLAPHFKPDGTLFTCSDPVPNGARP